MSRKAALSAKSGGRTARYAAEALPFPPDTLSWSLPQPSLWEPFPSSRTECPPFRCLDSKLIDRPALA